MRARKLTRIFVILIFIFIAVNLKYIFQMFFPLSHSEYIIKYSKEYNLNPFLVAAVIKTESNFKSFGFCERKRPAVYHSWK